MVRNRGAVKIIKERIEVSEIVGMWAVEKMLCYSGRVDQRPQISNVVLNT